MPRAAEDNLFGGKRGSAAKAYTAIIGQYGLAKGEQVYAALVNKRRALLRHGRSRR